MPNPFQSWSSDMQSIHQVIFAITPNDSVDLDPPSRGVYIGVAGDIKVTAVGGGTETYTVVAGSVLPVAVIRVFATGTTATGLKGGY